MTDKIILDVPLAQLELSESLREGLALLNCGTMGEILEKYHAHEILKTNEFDIRIFKEFIQFLEDQKIADLLKES